MLSRFWRSFGLALLLALVTSVTVFAKGGFSFISVTGADLNEPIRITDTRLTEDFFAFAYFFEDKTDTPSDPGIGYEITRFYIDGKREIAFDRLHYYPDTGFVFYDGIVNGSSEYDGDWYKASPNVADAFESALLAQTPSVTTSLNSQPVNAVSQPGTLAKQGQFMTSALILSGLALIFVLAFRFRRQAIH